MKVAGEASERKSHEVKLSLGPPGDEQRYCLFTSMAVPFVTIRRLSKRIALVNSSGVFFESKNATSWRFLIAGL